MEQIIETKQTTKQIIRDIALDISWAKLAKRYFDRSPSWIYHKIDGVDGNGGKGGFTEEEKEQFCGVLYDLAERIRKTADNLR